MGCGGPRWPGEIEKQVQTPPEESAHAGRAGSDCGSREGYWEMDLFHRDAVISCSPRFYGYIYRECNIRRQPILLFGRTWAPSPGLSFPSLVWIWLLWGHPSLRSLLILQCLGSLPHWKESPGTPLLAPSLYSHVCLGCLKWKPPEHVREGR